MNNIKMLYYDRIDSSEGIDFNKTSKSKEYDICNYSYILSKRFESQTYICNRCHDLLMMSMSLNDITVLSIRVSDTCCIISRISKREAIRKWNIMKHKLY